MDVIKKKYPILDENGQSATYPTFASQVFFEDGKSLESHAINHLMTRISLNVPASGWIQSGSGRYTQTISVNNIVASSKCYHIDIDMSTATEATFKNIKDAWMLVDNAETVNGGIMLTCFSEAPSIDFNLIADIEEAIMDLPSALGVTF